MELFSVLITLWRLRLHIGLAIELPDPPDPPEREAPGPLPSLAPLEPMAVVLTDDDDDLGDRLGFR